MWNNRRKCSILIIITNYECGGVMETRYPAKFLVEMEGHLGET
jgi:hypothetical protein